MALEGGIDFLAPTEEPCECQSRAAWVLVGPCTCWACTSAGLPALGSLGLVASASGGDHPGTEGERCESSLVPTLFSPVMRREDKINN